MRGLRGFRRHKRVQWRAAVRVAKYEGDWSAEQIDAGEADHALVEVVEREGNLLMNGGISVIWQALIGNGTAAADQLLTFFSPARAAIGVGDSTTAVAATQNDLQAGANKVRVGMDAGYPVHTDGTTSGATSLQFRSTYGTAVANWVWNEWAVFNSVTAAVGRMLNRKVESLGTKPNTQTWQLLVSLSLS